MQWARIRCSRLVSAAGFQGPTLHHVSLQVSDLARSSEFYRRVFGFTAQKRDDVTEPYWRVIREGAIAEKEIAEVLKGT